MQINYIKDGKEQDMAVNEYRNVEMIDDYSMRVNVANFNEVDEDTGDNFFLQTLYFAENIKQTGTNDYIANNGNVIIQTRFNDEDEIDKIWFNLLKDGEVINLVVDKDIPYEVVIDVENKKLLQMIIEIRNDDYTVKMQIDFDLFS